jgi:hypothetical protein
MATNPRIPDQRDRKGPVLAPKMELQDKRGRSWLPWLALLAGVAMLAAILYYMPRAPKASAPPAAATVPNQPTGAQLQLSQLQLSAPGPDGSVNLDGMIFNNGNTPVLAITAEATFRDQSGQIISRVPTGMLSVDKDGAATKTFADDPLKPQGQRHFRMQFHNLPDTWNHQAPEIRISDVSATTK